jgi:hypothetical protein
MDMLKVNSFISKNLRTLFIFYRTESNLDEEKMFLNKNYRIFRPIARALSIQKRSEIVKNEHARYTLERFPTDNARVICTKKGIGKYGIMY